MISAVEHALKEAALMEAVFLAAEFPPVQAVEVMRLCLEALSDSGLTLDPI